MKKERWIIHRQIINKRNVVWMCKSSICGWFIIVFISIYFFYVHDIQLIDDRWIQEWIMDEFWNGIEWCCGGLILFALGQTLRWAFGDISHCRAIGFCLEASEKSEASAVCPQLMNYDSEKNQTNRFPFLCGKCMYNNKSLHVRGVCCDGNEENTPIRFPLLLQGVEKLNRGSRKRKSFDKNPEGIFFAQRYNKNT